MCKSALSPESYRQKGRIPVPLTKGSKRLLHKILAVAHSVDAMKQVGCTGNNPLLEPILREEGVPAELAAVVFVESRGQAT